ncbi:leucine-rich repeat domain-containing protein [Paenibacillus xylanexedens]|uniref:leucine-rich repeat domain-containing protein n=1 Tax=Paenibacillus xylanexedens TaxID=528191 RepID=UPI001F1BE733|nr:leucine-rich repeat domain-containing protein [Paenibacillus xylanexedens]MCF7754798.1 leucine-rich repeat domain-containing protein [Paenibacillus xylanexedens]
MDITYAFTDERFRQVVLDRFCDQRDFIQESDVCEVEILQLSNHIISNLNGIEYFRGLQELDCAYNQLTGLDLTQNHKLRTLRCRENQLLTLDLSSNSELQVLDCSFNRLRKLDLSHNSRFVMVECHWNMLSELATEPLEQLEELSCSYNALFSLELEHNKQLRRLDCANNSMLELDVTGCPNLIELRCNHNHIKQLDLRSNLVLESVRCFNNHIRELEIRHNVQLRELYCSENKLTELDYSANPKLERLQYADNLIFESNHEIQGMGVFQYDASMSNYQIRLLVQENELVVTAQVSTKTEMEALSPYLEETWKRWDMLGERALKTIAEAHPDEDINALILADAEFQGDQYFRLGYDAGDTPAGRLYIYAEFDDEFHMLDTLIYETY